MNILKILSNKETINGFYDYCINEYICLCTYTVGSLHPPPTLNLIIKISLNKKYIFCHTEGLNKHAIL